jgi:cell division protein FtsL
MISQRPNRKNLAGGISIAFLIVFFLTFYIWHQAESVSVGYSTRDLEEKIKQLTKNIEVLETRKASLLSLEKVERAAREKLGMVTPKEGQIFYEDIELFD